MSQEQEIQAFGANRDFRIMVENVLDVVAVVQPNGRIDFVSESVRRVLGFEPSELLGTNALDLFHPDDRWLIAAVISQPDVHNEGHLYPARYCHKNGEWRTLEASGKRLEDGRLIIAARDITQRLNAENALHESRERLQSVMNNAPIMIWALDCEGIFTFTDGKILPQVCSFPGASIGESIYERYQSQAQIIEATRRALGGESFTFILTLNEHTFSARYEPIYDEAGVFSGTIGVATDITDQWEAQKQLHFQAAVLGAVQQGALVTDTTSRVCYWNHAAEEMLGWTAEEALGREIRELFVRSPLSGQMREVAQLVYKGESWSGEVTLTRRDGTSFPASISKSPVREGGENIGIATIFTDISARRESEAALRASEERYALAARGSNAGMWDWNIATNSVYYSDRWKAMLGWQTHEISDSPEEWMSRVHPDEVEDLRGAIARHLNGESQHFEAEFRVRHEDGTYRWMIARGIAVFDEFGTPLRFAGSQTDVTERKVAEEQLLQNAFFDNLTALPNRALFMDRLDRMIARAQRRPEITFALLFLDLDRFKNVNDSLGHGLGDQLLVNVARRLEGCLRTNDTLARLGGDEFAILLDDIDDIGDATHLAERVQIALREPLHIGGHDIFASVSVGITFSTAPSGTDLADGVASGHYTDPQEMVRDADTAMYRAKFQGKARHEVFNSAMHERAFDLLRTETELRRAIERDELETHYQPIVSLESGELVAFEALVRWRHPERGLVPPNEFIPVAEDSGLILPLGQWVLRDVCRQMRAWKNNGEVKNCTPCVAVNISSRQFTPALVQQVRDCLAEFDLGSACIKLEITESVIMENADSAVAMLRELKELGIHLSIDDFGTGYSSLAALYQFPLDTLKIDRSFIRRLRANGENSEIVRTILALAQNLNMSVVAEGIETLEQFEVLRDLGCGCAQGFLMARPVDVERAQTLLDAEPYWWQSDAGA